MIISTHNWIPSGMSSMFATCIKVLSHCCKSSGVKTNLTGICIGLPLANTNIIVRLFLRAVSNVLCSTSTCSGGSSFL